MIPSYGICKGSWNSYSRNMMIGKSSRTDSLPSRALADNDDSDILFQKLVLEVFI